jgi:hypothetical protein
VSERIRARKRYVPLPVLGLNDPERLVMLVIQYFQSWRGRLSCTSNTKPSGAVMLDQTTEYVFLSEPLDGETRIGTSTWPPMFGWGVHVNRYPPAAVKVNHVLGPPGPTKPES